MASEMYEQNHGTASEQATAASAEAALSEPVCLGVTEDSAESCRAGPTGFSELIVLGLSYSATERDVRDYFERFGALTQVEIGVDPTTKRSRGFARISFANPDHAKRACTRMHNIAGRQCEVRVPRSAEDRKIPYRLFVGRLPQGIAKVDLESFFNPFGLITDAYVPNPFRGFGFVTFADVKSVRKVISQKHVLQGQELNVCFADPRDESAKNVAEPETYRSRAAPVRYAAKKSFRDGLPCRLFVGRLPTDVSEQSLRAHFSQYGAIGDCYIPVPRRNFGFITYLSEDSVRNAIAVKHVINGKEVNVCFAEPREEEEEEAAPPSKRAGSDYGRGGPGGPKTQYATQHGRPFHQPYGSYAGGGDTYPGHQGMHAQAADPYHPGHAHQGLPMGVNRAEPTQAYPDPYATHPTYSTLNATNPSLPGAQQPSYDSQTVQYVPRTIYVAQTVDASRPGPPAQVFYEAPGGGYTAHPPRDDLASSRVAPMSLPPGPHGYSVYRNGSPPPPQGVARG